MKMKWQGLALAAALAGLAASAQAALVSFDNPGLIEFDDPGTSQSYTEAGFTFSSEAFGFGLSDDGNGNGVLVGGLFGSMPLTLRATSGGNFSLLALDIAFDPFFGGLPGDLTLVGLQGSSPVATQTLSVASGPALVLRFGSNWAGLTAVTFSGPLGFTLDNVSAVPEPGSLLLAALGLGALLASRASRASRVSCRSGVAGADCVSA